MTLIINAVVRPKKLQWWQWGQLLGLILPLLWISVGINHPLLWAMAIHFLVDFTAQSDETSAGKSNGNKRVLAYHAFLAGGYTGLIVGGLPGLVVSILVHFLIDATNKFGLSGPTGCYLDQAAHLLTLVAIWSIF